MRGTRNEPTPNGQFKNLLALQKKKQSKLELLKRRATKLGQLRAYDRMGYLIREEIKKESKDLRIIEEDITSFNE